MDRVYGSQDHDCLSVHGELVTMGQHGYSGAREVIVIAQRERERERGGRRGYHQWRHLEAELRRWPYDDTQQRRPVVLRWGDGSGCEEERLELG
jgi:hypothetical protein